MSDHTQLMVNCWWNRSRVFNGNYYCSKCYPKDEAVSKARLQINRSIIVKQSIHFALLIGCCCNCCETSTSTTNLVIVSCWQAFVVSRRMPLLCRRQNRQQIELLFTCALIFRFAILFVRSLDDYRCIIVARCRVTTRTNNVVYFYIKTKTFDLVADGLKFS